MYRKWADKLERSADPESSLTDLLGKRHWFAHSLRGWLLSQMSRTRAAEVEFLEAAERLPSATENDDESVRALSHLSFVRENVLMEGDTLFDEPLRPFPAGSNPRHRIFRTLKTQDGFECLQRGDSLQAREIFEESLGDPHLHTCIGAHTATHMGLVSCALSTGTRGEAFGHLAEAIKCFLSTPSRRVFTRYRVAARIAVAYRELGDDQRARRWASEIDPSSPLARHLSDRSEQLLNMATTTGRLILI